MLYFYKDFCAKCLKIRTSIRSDNFLFTLTSICRRFLISLGCQMKKASVSRIRLVSPSIVVVGLWQISGNKWLPADRQSDAVVHPLEMYLWGIDRAGMSVSNACLNLFHLLGRHLNLYRLEGALQATETWKTHVFDTICRQLATIDLFPCFLFIYVSLAFRGEGFKWKGLFNRIFSFQSTFSSLHGPSFAFTSAYRWMSVFIYSLYPHSPHFPSKVT